MRYGSSDARLGRSTGWVCNRYGFKLLLLLPQHVCCWVGMSRLLLCSGQGRRVRGGVAGLALACRWGHLPGRQGKAGRAGQQQQVWGQCVVYGRG